jgi:hypothetical protein
LKRRPGTRKSNEPKLQKNYQKPNLTRACVARCTGNLNFKGLYTRDRQPKPAAALIRERYAMLQHRVALAVGSKVIFMLLPVCFCIEPLMEYTGLHANDLTAND